MIALMRALSSIFGVKSRPGCGAMLVALSAASGAETAGSSTRLAMDCPPSRSSRAEILVSEAYEYDVEKTMAATAASFNQKFLLSMLIFLFPAYLTTAVQLY